MARSAHVVRGSDGRARSSWEAGNDRSAIIRMSFVAFDLRCNDRPDFDRACKKYCVNVGNRVFPPILFSLRRFSHGCDFDRQGQTARERDRDAGEDAG